MTTATPLLNIPVPEGEPPRQLVRKDTGEAAVVAVLDDGRWQLLGEWIDPNEGFEQAMLATGDGYPCRDPVVDLLLVTVLALALEAAGNRPEPDPAPPAPSAPVPWSGGEVVGLHIWLAAADAGGGP